MSTRALASAAALALLAAVALVAARRPDPRLAATVPALLVLDLLAYGHRYAATVPVEAVQAPPAVVELLGPPDPELRVGTSVRGRDFPYPGSFARSHGGLNSVGQIWMHRMLLTGHGTPQGVFGTIPAAWRDLLIGPFAFDPGDERVEPDPVRDLVAGALWIDPAEEAKPRPGWTRAGEADGVVLSRRDAPLGRAWIARRCAVAESSQAALRRLRDPAFDPAAEAIAVGACPPGLGAGEASGEARVVEDIGERIAVELRVDGAEPALLVLSDNPLPGWSATVDGVPADIHRVNLAMRGLVVPPGEHRVAMRYRPRSFALGAASSASALALCVALVVAGRRRSAR